MADRMSELPIVIIQRIMELLPTKQAARSIVLSKLFLRAWSTRYFLDLDQGHFPNLSEDELLNFVDGTLDNYSQQGQHRMSIDRFVLHIHSVESDKFLPLLDKWLPMVLRNDNLLQLSFRIEWKSNSVAPQIFGPKSLQTLYVSSYIYPRRHVSLVLQNSDIRCHNLKSLTLESLRMDDATFTNLVNCCPLIEKLFLVDCWGQFKVRIANLPYLRILDLYFCGVQDYDIDAPMLQNLRCWTRSRLNIGESGNLRHLEVFHSSLVDEQLDNILSKNPMLEYLSLRDCNMLAYLKLHRCNMLKQINVSSTSLKRLRIYECVHLVEAIIDVPNLDQILYYNSGKIGLHITSPRPISKAHIGIDYPLEIDASWFHGLREFLTNFQQSDVEIIAFQDMQFNCEGFRAMPLPYGHEVKNLWLKYKRPICIEYLDGLLSTCHPTFVECIYRDTRSDNALMRNFMKNITSRKIPNCCVSDEIKCWRHYLKDVKLRRAVGREWKPLRLNTFFLSRFFSFLIRLLFSFLIRFLSRFFKVSTVQKDPKVIVSFRFRREK